jgi:ferredoxin
MDKSCVQVCPVECFYDAGNMLVINPDECTDCQACHVECPVSAIYFDHQIPHELASYIKINAELSKTCARILG